MPASAEEVYQFHMEADALERLTPPWEKSRVVARTGSIEEPGSRVTLRVKVGPFAQDWVAEHKEFLKGRMFRDAMVSGPFRKWEHTHEFVAESENSSWLADRVEYEFPLGWLGKLLGGGYTRGRLERMFRYRHRKTEQELVLRKKREKGSYGEYAD
jgi:ligand-binding SRPBCC domain-containing protein